MNLVESAISLKCKYNTEPVTLGDSEKQVGMSPKCSAIMIQTTNLTRKYEIKVITLWYAE